MISYIFFRVLFYGYFWIFFSFVVLRLIAYFDQHTRRKRFKTIIYDMLVIVLTSTIWPILALSKKGRSQLS